MKEQKFKKGDYVVWKTAKSQERGTKGGVRWILYEFVEYTGATTTSARGMVLYDSGETLSINHISTIFQVEHGWRELYWLQKGDAGMLGDSFIKDNVVVQEIIADKEERVSIRFSYVGKSRTSLERDLYVRKYFNFK